jgi:hypothetical protein
MRVVSLAACLRKIASSIRAHPRTDGIDRVVAIQLTAYFSLVALCMDITKAAWWPLWRPVHLRGLLGVCGAYVLVAILCALVSTAVIRQIREWFYIYPLVVLVFFLGGLSENFWVEHGIIPIFWHPTLGIFAAVLIGFRRFVNEVDGVLRRPRIRPDQREAIKYLDKQFFGGARFLAQMLFAYTAIFGVAMSIVFSAKDAINDDNYKATGLQMFVAYLGTIFGVYFWFGVPFMRLASRIRLNRLRTIRIRAAEITRTEVREVLGTKRKRGKRPRRSG